LEDSSALQDVPQFGSYLWEKTDKIVVKILSETYLWTRKALLNFGNHPDSDQIRLGIGLA